MVGGPGVAGRTELHRRQLRSLIGAYDSWITRAYCVVRFRIIRGRFLEEIGQFLPSSGHVVEVGCGFGLFSLYFAQEMPQVSIHGFDISEPRIARATKAKARLGLTNVDFAVGDAREADLPEGVDAFYMLDIVHHVPHDAARDLLRATHEQLQPGGVLIVKDVTVRPLYKMAFTWLLDVIMTRGERPEYWSRAEMLETLQSIGFEVFTYAMVDLLPYPHQLYVCRKAPAPET